MKEINKGEGDIDCTLDKLASICSNYGRAEDDDNTQVECKTEAILPLNANKGDEHQITVADGVPGEYIYIYIYIYMYMYVCILMIQLKE